MLRCSHICLEVTVDPTWVGKGGNFEKLYGPRIRDRMGLNHNRVTNRCRIVKGTGTPGGPSFGSGIPLGLPGVNRAASTRDMILVKSRFFQPMTMASWDGTEVLSRGIRHFESEAVGARLPSDDKLRHFLHLLDHGGKMPCWRKGEKICTGEPEQCQCDRQSRPRNPGLVLGLGSDLARHTASFLELADFASMAGVCWFTWQTYELDMPYWRKVIETHDDSHTYVPLQSMTTTKTTTTKKQTQEMELAIKAKEARRRIQTQGVQPWQRAEIKEKDPFDPMIRRWGKIIGIQRLYIRAYHNLQAETTDFLDIPDITREEREHLINKAHAEFKKKTHVCSLCRRRPVPFEDHFGDQSTKAVGGTFMACTDCVAHQVWTKQQARMLWGFTNKQSGKIPFWRVSTTVRFCTADLLFYRQRMPLLHKYVCFCCLFWVLSPTSGSKRVVGPLNRAHTTAGTTYRPLYKRLCRSPWWTWPLLLSMRKPLSL